MKKLSSFYYKLFLKNTLHVLARGARTNLKILGVRVIKNFGYHCHRAYKICSNELLDSEVKNMKCILIKIEYRKDSTKKVIK